MKASLFASLFLTGLIYGSACAATIVVTDRTCLINFNSSASTTFDDIDGWNNFTNTASGSTLVAKSELKDANQVKIGSITIQGLVVEPDLELIGQDH